LTLARTDSDAIAARSAITLYKTIAFLYHENIPEELFKNAAEKYKRNINMEQKRGLSLSITMLDSNILFLDDRGEWDKSWGCN